jgi:hypothetical protein
VRTDVICSSKIGGSEKCDAFALFLELRRELVVASSLGFVLIENAQEQLKRGSLGRPQSLRFFANRR